MTGWLYFLLALYNPGGGAKMQHKDYSAGAVKLSFWFAEFRKVVSLLRSGKSMEDIKLLAEQDNIFSASTPSRSKQIYNAVSARMSALTDEYYNLFEISSIETQKLIVLVSIMNTNTLFFDFMNDIYREKLITGDTVISDADVRVFFHDKQRESEKVAVWTDETLARLGTCYKTYLLEAGLLDRGVGERKVIKPLVDGRLAALLSESGMNPILKVLTGTR
jgi:hypothetical protein